MEKLRACDRAAWEDAYPLLWRTLQACLTSPLGFATQNDLENLAAEILAEEVMPQVLEPKTDSFNQIRSFDDLLNMTRAIAKLRAIDFIRKRSRRPEELMAEVPEAPVLGVPGAEAASDLMDFALAHLEPPDPELFLDRFQLGLTTRQIAEKRGMSHGTVVSRFSRAFAKLRPLLGREVLH